jgi:hypothetical protein
VDVAERVPEQLVVRLDADDERLRGVVGEPDDQTRPPRLLAQEEERAAGQDLGREDLFVADGDPRD